MTEEYIPKIAMSIHAHPDDQEFSIGGTLARWARAGCQIISVVITSGDSGSNDPARDGSYKKELADLREKEQLSANEVLGVKETIFLRYPDGELEPRRHSRCGRAAGGRTCGHRRWCSLPFWLP